MTGGLVLGCFGLWDWIGWDRASVVGSQRFGLVAFGLMVVGMTTLAIGVVAPQVSISIASERDRKTLDALLASRFSSAQIVLGSMAAGLFRFANAMLAALPVVVLLVYLGGIPPLLTILTGAALASMACLLAGFAVAASVGARTAARAVNASTGMFMLWAMFPTLFIMLRSLFWPGAPSWLISTLLILMDGSPLGLVVNLGGLIPRPGGALEALVRMIAWELGLAVALVIWAIVRLRPASRALYDVEGQATRIKMIKAALRRPPSRPPCFDDPVLWYEIHSTLGQTAVKRWIGRTIGLAMLGCLAVLTWWFAKPAFDELLERGYRTSPEAFKMPELEPFARVLIGKLFRNLASSVTPGQARLEFNIVLREFTGLFIIGFIAMIYQYAFESIKGEQKRDTWLGLIATPLTGREILRGKTFGSLWKARDTAFTMIVLWALGLATGAVHPLGFLAAIVFAGVAAAFFAALALSMALDASNPEKPPSIAALSPFNLVFVFAALTVLSVGPMTLAWASLLTYEDVHALTQDGPFYQFRDWKLKTYLGARSVAVLWLAATATFALGAVWLSRANVRRFDEAIGRPVRPE